MGKRKSAVLKLSRKSVHTFCADITKIIKICDTTDRYMSACYNLFKALHSNKIYKVTYAVSKQIKTTLKAAY